MKYPIIVFYIFFLFIAQLYGQSTTVRYPSHETVVSYSFYENDTLYLGLANSKDFSGTFFNTKSFFKQVKLTKLNNSIWQSTVYSDVDSTIFSFINATFFKKDSLYFAVGPAIVSISPQQMQIAYYVGNSTEIDSLRFFPFTASGFGIYGVLPHPINDSVLLVYGAQVFHGPPHLFEPLIIEFNFYTEAYNMHIYDNNPYYPGVFEGLLYNEKQHKYIGLSSLPLPPNTSSNPQPATAFSYLDTSFVLDTTTLISSTIVLTYPRHFGGDKVFEMANMIWVTDSTIMVTGEVNNPSVWPKPSASNSDRYGEDIAVSIRNASDFSEIGTTKVYGKLDTGETADLIKPYPLVRMDSNLFVTASTVDYDGYYMGSAWDTELALLGVDMNGNKHWMEYIPYNDYCEVDKILPDEKGGLWVVSQCSNADTTGGDWFVKVMYIDSVAYWPRIGTVGLSEPENHKGNIFRIYPNPADQMVTIRKTAEKDVEAEILDVNGRLVKRIKIDGNESAFDVSELKAGMYFVKTSSKEGGVAVKKLMIK